MQVAQCIEQGVRKILPTAQTRKVPVADGGEGTLEAVMSVVSGKYQEIMAQDPLGRERRCRYAVLPGEIALVEMAESTGLGLLSEAERDPERASSFGLGQLISAALEAGVKRIVVGIGGSATNDGGMGMAAALGAKFYNNRGELLAASGQSLSQVERIDVSDLDPRLKQTEIIVAGDVNNTLCGPHGATRVFGPQKGATPMMLDQLEQGLENFAAVIARDLGKHVRDVEGAGAAGGVGAALLAFAGAQRQSGIETVLDLINFEQILSKADLVITGEGKIDEQSLFGKVPIGIARRAKQRNLPVIVIVGAATDEAYMAHDVGIDAILPIVNRPMSLVEAMSNAQQLIALASEQAMRLMKIGAAQ